MLKKRKKPVETDFYTLFVGEFVELTLSVSESAEEEMEEGLVKSYTGPIRVRGYFLDMYETHYVLGDTPESAAMIVQKDKVVALRIIKDEVLNTVYDSILDAMPSRPDKKEIN